VLLEASTAQYFAGRRIFDPVRRQLVARGRLSLGDLIGLTHAEIFAGAPKAFGVRRAFIRELESLGFIFSPIRRPVPRWRRRVDHALP